MIPYSLLSQIALIAVAGVLTVTYIKPMFTSISDTQDKISVYQQEKDKVAVVNQRLATLVKEVDAVSLEDHKKLLTYMPDSVDTIAVPRDLQAIAAKAGVAVSGIKYGGPTQIPVNDDGVSSINVPESHTFVIDFESTYEQLKTMLSYFEQNHYPLEVTEMQVQKKEDGLLNVSIKLITYDRTPPPAPLLEVLE